jgi:hypothetical protein
MSKSNVYKYIPIAMKKILHPQNPAMFRFQPCELPPRETEELAWEALDLELKHELGGSFGEVKKIIFIEDTDLKPVPPNLSLVKN